MNGAFAERITVIDVWSSGSNLYRLVNRGAGPLQLQKYESDGTVEEWIPESTQYVHGVLCHRIAMLSENRGDGMKNDTGGDGRPTVSEKMPERWSYAGGWHLLDYDHHPLTDDQRAAVDDAIDGIVPIDSVVVDRWRQGKPTEAGLYIVACADYSNQMAVRIVDCGEGLDYYTLQGDFLGTLPDEWADDDWILGPLPDLTRTGEAPDA